jgi:SAM-dependent methyltransferase
LDQLNLQEQSRLGRLAGLLACPDCRAPLDDAGEAPVPPACPGCGRAFALAGVVPLLHPAGSAALADGQRFFIEEPGRMDRLRREHPRLARLLELPDFTVATDALPLCRAWFERNVRTGPGDGRILNLGSGVHKLYRNPALVNFDIAPHENADVAGDGERLPFRDGVFDGALLDAVIEHLARPQVVVAEVRRVLKPGGVVLAQVPFLYPFHAAPHDYQRFTPAGLRMLFEEFDTLEAGTDRRPGRALLEVVTAWAAGFSDDRTRSYLLRWASAWLWLPVKFLDPWLARKSRAEYVAASSSILARKRPNS